MDYADATAHDIADALAKALSNSVDYVAVDSDGAACAAALLSDLI